MRLRQTRRRISNGADPGFLNRHRIHQSPERQVDDLNLPIHPKVLPRYVIVLRGPRSQQQGVASRFRFLAPNTDPLCPAGGSVLENAPGCDRPRWRPGSSFLQRQMEAEPMAKSKAKRKRTPKYVLKLPDLEQSKSAVLNSLTSRSSQRTYDHAIRQFIEWYYSEPRLAFNKTVVTRYRISLGQRRYASTTINLRLAAVRRLAYEAADCGLLSADLAAGIGRVKGAKRLGVPVGSPSQGSRD